MKDALQRNRLSLANGNSGITLAGAGGRASGIPDSARERLIPPAARANAASHNKKRAFESGRLSEN
jgi:hypothetical protein